MTRGQRLHATDPPKLTAVATQHAAVTEKHTQTLKMIFKNIWFDSRSIVQKSRDVCPEVTAELQSVSQHLQVAKTKLKNVPVVMMIDRFSLLPDAELIDIGNVWKRSDCNFTLVPAIFRLILTAGRMSPWEYVTFFSDDASSLSSVSHSGLILIHNLIDVHLVSTSPPPGFVPLLILGTFPVRTGKPPQIKWSSLSVQSSQSLSFAALSSRAV